MSDMITVVDPGYDMSFWPWVGVGVLAIGLVSFFFLVFSRLSSTRSIARGWWQAYKVVGIIAICAVPAGLASSAVLSAHFYNLNVEDAKAQAIEALGYSQIEFEDVDDYKFTAYRNEEYVKAAAIEVVPLTWQVIELDIPGVK